MSLAEDCPLYDSILRPFPSPMSEKIRSRRNTLASADRGGGNGSVLFCLSGVGRPIRLTNRVGETLRTKSDVVSQAENRWPDVAKVAATAKRKARKRMFEPLEEMVAPGIHKAGPGPLQLGQVLPDKQ